MGTACMLQPLFQPHSLNGKNLLTPAAPLLYVARHKGTAVHKPKQLFLLAGFHPG